MREDKKFWWKSLGDDLRTGHIDRTTPMGKALRKVYFAQMLSVLNIHLEDKKEASDNESIKV